MAPAISGLLKSSLLKRVVSDREILTNAHLDDRRYSYYVAMLVHSSLARTRKILTHYPLYSKLISYVDRADYSPGTHILDVEGGVWMFRMRSWVRFEERGLGWIHYKVVGGRYFVGLEGNIYFESGPEKGTLVYFDGAQQGDHWPPRVVIERGAEIVFGFTARRMRNYLESNEDAPPVGAPIGDSQRHDDETIPKPRAHL
ncbi:hypothetical protein WDW37_11450 [Bdellovibrionota bacterium FG-1]